MAKDQIATHHQAAFLGGEWSPQAQGRTDLPAYKHAMNACLNAIIYEEGAWTRRPGLQFMAFTRGRTAAKLLPFVSTAKVPYLMEFTNLGLQFHYGTGPVCTNDVRTVLTSTYAAGAMTLDLDAAHGWAVGDLIRLSFPSSVDFTVRGPFQNRVFQITAAPDADTITFKDDLGVALVAPSSVAANAFADVRVLRIKKFTTTYATAHLDGLRAVQAQTNSFILSSSKLPQIVTITTAASGDGDPTFSFSASDFQDGPYLDDATNSSTGATHTGAVSAYTGTITFTPTAGAGALTFSASDVGRLIRLWTEPAAWNAATTYSYGQTVSYGGTFWKSLAQGAYASLNVGIVPGTVPPLSTGQSVNLWAPAPLEGRWAWGTISAQATTSCTVVLETDLNSVNGATVSRFRLGVFTTGAFPTCGVYHGGRLCLAGAVANRIDMSSTTGAQIFSPTDIYGNVADSHAIAAELNSEDIENFHWMVSDQQGLLIGTAGGEWLLSASDTNDPITTTSRQASKVTKYRARNVEPRRVGAALIFAQYYGRRSLEYLPDTFNRRFSARHLNERAKHLSISGIEEIAYQEETAPVLWHRMGDGSLAGVSYRRISKFITDEPAFQAWHRHTLGGSYTVTSMSALPGVDGLSDKLYLCTRDPATGYYGIEVMTPLFEDMEDG